MELLIIILITGAAGIYLFKSFTKSLNSKKPGGCNCSGCSQSSCTLFKKED
ncbi:Cys-rich domain-containing protein [Desulfonema limicola]|uniref:Cys-rich domain-containing protein n=1 Tax=Desulfonema limicola TaxID=45656 RepID=A0A975B8G5_9BACT|nr:FeoB-associated Cys-rich membrane protein [Desulfonema limicola]QTA80709.1 Cys-rich domain-containing protein [Desulfonema limicola]